MNELRTIYQSSEDSSKCNTSRRSPKNAVYELTSKAGPAAVPRIPECGSGQCASRARVQADYGCDAARPQKVWPANVYSQVAISIKGGELREPGLANLAQRLAQRQQPSSSRRSLRPTYTDFMVGPVPGRSSGAMGGDMLGALRSSRRSSATRNVETVQPTERLPRSPRKLRALIWRCFKSRPAIVNATPATSTTTASALEVESSLC
jgi:hypothetical protein